MQIPFATVTMFDMAFEPGRSGRTGGDAMCQHEPTACIGITPDAITVTVDGKPAVVIPRERMLDLVVRIGIALGESAPSR